MRAVSVVLSTAHQDTGLVDYFNYRVAATAVSSSEAATTSAKSEHSRSASAGHAKRRITSRRAAAPRRRRSSGWSIACASAPAIAASSSGSTSHPVWPGRTMSAGPKRSTATAGRPQAADADGGRAAGHAPDERRAELLAHRGEDHDVGGGEVLRKLVVLVPAGEVDVARARRADRVVGVLGLPLARVAAHEDQRGGSAAVAQRLARASEGAHQQAEALDLGEAAHRQQNGAAGHRGRLLGAVDHRALVVAGPPAVRVVDEGVTPEGGPVDRPRREALGVEAVGRDHAPARIDAQHTLGALELAV